MDTKLKIGIVGVGFIGISHIEAVRRIGTAELVAVADANTALARQRAEEFGVPKCYNTPEELIADREITVIHNCTPNNLHLPINRQVIAAGKHILSEKPLGMSSEETGALVQLLEQHPEVLSCVNFNYRMNPLVQDMKCRIQNGEIGRPMLVHGSYLQDWLLYDTDYSWRIDPDISGPSRCVADIGSHWMDCAQTVTGACITHVMADLAIVLPVRKKPRGQVQSFAKNNSTDYDEVSITTEDYGAVLFKMDNGARGVFYVSQVSAGRKCRLDIEVDGSKASLYWNQENADQMWMGFRDQDNRQMIRNPLFIDPKAQRYTYLAAGHPEGWNDALKNNIQSFYDFIRAKRRAGEPCDFATFQDGHQVVKLTEAILKSSRQNAWVAVEPGHQ